MASAKTFIGMLLTRDFLLVSEALPQEYDNADRDRPPEGANGSVLHGPVWPFRQYPEAPVTPPRHASRWGHSKIARLVFLARQ